MADTDNTERLATYHAQPERGLYPSIQAQRVAAQKRVIRAADREWVNNLQQLVDGSNGFEMRAVDCFLRRIPPGGKSDIHRHNFEAIGYVVKGRGYEIHDGEKIDWAEGDVVYIPPNVWHQHCNADAENEAVVLLIKDSPLLLHLGICTLEPAPSWEDALSRPSAIPDPRLARRE
jgi:quercetin dioxygenase-like cupin family protein